MKDLTELVQAAVESGRCAIIHRSSIFLTDRPENRGMKGFKGDQGDSDVEAGHAFDMVKLIEAMTPRFTRIYVSLNNIRIFGPISSKNCLHFHGYSRSQLFKEPERFHCIILTVHAIAPYNPETKQIDQSHRWEELIINGQAGVVFLYEIDGRIQIEPMRVGDMIILPSGTYHSFAAAPGVFASYGAIELCDNPAFMYQAHYDEGGRNASEVISKTIGQMSGKAAIQSGDLDLRSIPGLKLYVETRTQQS